MNAADLATFDALKPFIMARMARGESFESALRHAPADADAFLRARKADILDDVWNDLRA